MLQKVSIAVLAVGVGVMCASTALIARLGPPIVLELLETPVVFLASAAPAGLVAARIVRKRAASPARAAAMTLAGLAFAALPWVSRDLQLHYIVRYGIPRYSNAIELESAVESIFPSPNLFVRLRTTANVEQVLDFYDAELARRGWVYQGPEAGAVPSWRTLRTWWEGSSASYTGSNRLGWAPNVLYFADRRGNRLKVELLPEGPAMLVDLDWTNPLVPLFQ